MKNSTARKAPTSSATKTASKVIELKASVTTGKAAKEAQASKAQANETLTVQCLGDAICLPQAKPILRLSVGALMVALKNST